MFVAVTALLAVLLFVAEANAVPGLSFTTKVEFTKDFKFPVSGSTFSKKWENKSYVEVSKRVDRLEKKLTGSDNANVKVWMKKITLLEKNVEVLRERINVLATNTNNNFTRDVKPTPNRAVLAKKRKSWIEILKSVERLEKKLSTSDNGKVLTKRIIALENKVKRIKDKTYGRSEYCNLLQGSPCGKCRCQDDDRLQNKFYCDCQHIPPQRDCVEFAKRGYNVSGIYQVHLQTKKVIQIYCDQETDGGGWAVIQRRVDGSVNFYRGWENYKAGFGSLQNEFWLGNKNIFALTHQTLLGKGSELRIEMQYWLGVRKFAKYDTFQVGDESTYFKLHVTGHSGNAGDGGRGLSYHNGMPFSTFDRDHDAWSSNCAAVWKGGWWFKKCHYVDLNGRYYLYKENVQSKGIHWSYMDKEKKSMKFAEMKVRRKQ